MSLIERSVGGKDQAAPLRASDMFDFTSGLTSLRVKPDVVVKFGMRRGIGDTSRATDVFCETFLNATPVTIKPRDLPKDMPKAKGGRWEFFADPENPDLVYRVIAKGNTVSVEGVLNLGARGTRGVTY